jgi:NADH-quinone oxidoreductase subunit F
MGSEKSPGYTLYSLSGHVTRPGQYEAPLGITLRELLDYAGGVRAGHQLKFWTPGGSSTPLLTAEHLDVPLDYEGVGAAGSMLGTKALEIFDETTCVVRAVGRWIDFYKHESCGKCTPCREGTFWLSQIYHRLETGHGTAEDLDKLLDISDAILGKSFCALGDGAASPVASSIQFFRDEYVAHIEAAAVRSTPSCPCSPRTEPHDSDGRYRKEGHPARAGDADHRRHRNQRSQGNFGDPGRRVDRRADTPVLRPPAAGPGGRVPPVPGGDRRPA